MSHPVSGAIEYQGTVADHCARVHPSWDECTEFKNGFQVHHARVENDIGDRLATEDIVEMPDEGNSGLWPDDTVRYQVLDADFLTVDNDLADNQWVRAG